MKRIITYLYEYNNGKKVTNSGFIKLDIREKDCRIEISLKNGKNRMEEGDVSLIVKQEKTEGILMGKIKMNDAERMTNQWIFSRKKINGSNYHFTDIQGVGITFPSGRYLASSWVTEPVEELIRGNYNNWMRKEEKEPTKKRVELQESSISVEQGEKKNYPKRRGVRHINLHDIHSLPKKNWYLSNNSFLLHGFFNYHYLVILEEEWNGKKKYYLGVPGIYEHPERAMALLFGFPEFVPEKEQQNEKIPEGTFGFWVCLLDM